MEGGLVALQFFGHLKRALELLISVSNEPSRKILGPLGRYDHPRGKKANKHCELSSGGKHKIPHFCR